MPAVGHLATIPIILFFVLLTLSACLPGNTAQKAKETAPLETFDLAEDLSFALTQELLAVCLGYNTKGPASDLAMQEITTARATITRTLPPLIERFTLLAADTPFEFSYKQMDKAISAYTSGRKDIDLDLPSSNKSQNSRSAVRPISSAIETILNALHQELLKQHKLDAYPTLLARLRLLQVDYNLSMAVEAIAPQIQARRLIRNINRSLFASYHTRAHNYWRDVALVLQENLHALTFEVRYDIISGKVEVATQVEEDIEAMARTIFDHLSEQNFVFTDISEMAQEEQSASGVDDYDSRVDYRTSEEDILDLSNLYKQPVRNLGIHLRKPQKTAPES